MIRAAQNELSFVMVVFVFGWCGLVDGLVWGDLGACLLGGLRPCEV